MIKIVLIGPQGSGKSTQGKLLAEHLNIPFIATGDILREIALSETDEGKRIKEILDSGNLVEDATVAKLIRERVEKDDCKEGVILDGYPRTLEQAKLLEDINFEKAIYFKAPKEVVVERLIKRGRQDDTEELINKRLDLYYQQTEPLLEYYKKRQMLVEIEGQGDIESIQEDLRNKLS